MITLNLEFIQQQAVSCSLKVHNAHSKITELHFWIRPATSNLQATHLPYCVLHVRYPQCFCYWISEITVRPGMLDFWHSSSDKWLWWTAGLNGNRLRNLWDTDILVILLFSLLVCTGGYITVWKREPTVPGTATIVMMHEKIPIADPLQVTGILLITCRLCKSMRTPTVSRLAA